MTIAGLPDCRRIVSTAVVHRIPDSIFGWRSYLHSRIKSPADSDDESGASVSGDDSQPEFVLTFADLTKRVPQRQHRIQMSPAGLPSLAEL